MARVRCITEMGMGVDVHGRYSRKAARLPGEMWTRPS